MTRALEITGTLLGHVGASLHAWVRPGETLRWSHDPAAIAGRPCAPGERTLLGPPTTRAGEPFVVGAPTDAQGWTLRVPAGASLVDREGARLGVGALEARISRGSVRVELDGYVYEVRVVDAPAALPHASIIGVRECVAILGLLAPAAAAFAGHPAPPEDRSIEDLLVELDAEATRALPELRSVELAPAPGPRQPAPDAAIAPGAVPVATPTAPGAAVEGATVAGVEDILAERLVVVDADLEAGCGYGGDGPYCMPWDLLADVPAWLAAPAPSDLRFGRMDTALIESVLRRSLDFGTLARAQARGHAARVHRPVAEGALAGVELSRAWSDVARAVGSCVRTERWWTASVLADVDAEGRVVRVDVSGDHDACVARAVGRVRFGSVGAPGRVRFTLSAREW